MNTTGNCYYFANVDIKQMLLQNRGFCNTYS